MKLNGIEGGFWTVVTDDGTAYDTHNLPADFRQDGLRVTAKQQLRPDLACFHMAGPIADVIAIRKK